MRKKYKSLDKAPIKEPLSITNVKPVNIDEKLYKKQNGTLYPYENVITYRDLKPYYVSNYKALTNRDVMFKKMNDKSDYIIQPKGMLKRGTYCVTELYSTVTRKLIVEKLIQERMRQKMKTMLQSPERGSINNAVDEVTQEGSGIEQIHEHAQKQRNSLEKQKIKRKVQQFLRIQNECQTEQLEYKPKANKLLINSKSSLGLTKKEYFIEDTLVNQVKKLSQLAKHKIRGKILLNNEQQLLPFSLSRSKTLLKSTDIVDTHFISSKSQFGLTKQRPQTQLSAQQSNYSLPSTWINSNIKDKKFQQLLEQRQDIQASQIILSRQGQQSRKQSPYNLRPSTACVSGRKSQTEQKLSLLISQCQSAKKQNDSLHKTMSQFQLLIQLDRNEDAEDVDDDDIIRQTLM